MPVADTENSEMGGSILDTYYFSVMEFYKNNTKFQRKRGGRGPLGPPLNPPMYANSKISGETWAYGHVYMYYGQFMYLHVVKCDSSVLCKLLTEDGNLGIALAEVI